MIYLNKMLFFSHYHIIDTVVSHWETNEKGLIFWPAFVHFLFSFTGNKTKASTQSQHLMET